LLIPDGKAGRLFVGLLIKLNVHEMMPADARYVKGEGTSEADKSLSSLLRGYTGGCACHYGFVRDRSQGFSE
jgi:hypothetical protein